MEVTKKIKGIEMNSSLNVVWYVGLKQKEYLVKL